MCVHFSLVLPIFASPSHFSKQIAPSPSNASNSLCCQPHTSPSPNALQTRENRPSRHIAWDCPIYNVIMICKI